MGAVRAVRQQGWLAGVAMLVAVPYVVVATYSAFGGLPYNSIHLPGVSAIAPLRWLPQGWAFFSRDAREKDMYLWRWSDGRWQPASRAPHGEPRNLFGFARASRSQRAEAAALAASVADSLWSDCRAADTLCLELPGVGVPPSGAHRPSLCGRIGFVLRKPVPFAWARRTPTVVMPARATVVEVSC